VEEEDNLKYQSGDGEDLKVNFVADAECTVQGEGGNNQPRQEVCGGFSWLECIGDDERFYNRWTQLLRFRDKGR